MPAGRGTIGAILGILAFGSAAITSCYKGPGSGSPPTTTTISVPLTTTTSTTTTITIPPSTTTTTFPGTSPEHACANYAGTLGNDNRTTGSFSTIVWTCNNWPFAGNAGFATLANALGTVCLASGGNDYTSFRDDATMLGYFTCGVS